MRSFFNKIEKFIAKVKRDGLISAVKKAFIKIKNDYLSKIDIVRNLKYIKHKKEIKSLLDEMLYTKDYDRIIIWRSSIGWNIPLFQRPQHIANNLSKNINSTVTCGRPMSAPQFQKITPFRNLSKGCFYA